MFGLNVRYPLLMALLVAFADALPIIGSGTIIIPWAIISSVQGDINLAICLIVLYIIITIARQLLEPKVVGSQIGIHPIFTLLAINLFGILGMFVRANRYNYSKTNIWDFDR